MKEGIKNYKWDSNPIKAIEFGKVIVKPIKEKPLFWFNYECYKVPNRIAHIPAIKIVTSDDQVIIIANHCGIGIRKLKDGGTWRSIHFTIPDNCEFIQNDEYKITEFHEKLFIENEDARDKWQKEKYPKEYEKIEGLKESLKIMRRRIV